MPRIEEMYAFITEDTGPDDEGIIGMNTGLGWMPLVGADMARVESLRPLALQIAKNSGNKKSRLQSCAKLRVGYFTINHALRGSGKGMKAFLGVMGRLCPR